MKTIKVEEKTWNKLMKWRIDLNCKSLSELLERMVSIINKVELAEGNKK